MKAAEVFLLVDPPQDFEESLEIFGVFLTLEDARKASEMRRFRKNPARNSYAFKPRRLEIQHWRGTKHVDTEEIWDYPPEPEPTVEEQASDPSEMPGPTRPRVLGEGWPG